MRKEIIKQFENNLSKPASYMCYHAAKEGAEIPKRPLACIDCASSLCWYFPNRVIIDNIETKEIETSEQLEQLLGFCLFCMGRCTKILYDIRVIHEGLFKLSSKILFGIQDLLGLHE